MTPTPRPVSPCIQRCRLTPQGERCQSCGRTLDEIARWSTMDETSREKVWQRLDREGMP